MSCPLPIPYQSPTWPLPEPYPTPTQPLPNPYPTPTCPLPVPYPYGIPRSHIWMGTDTIFDFQPPPLNFSRPLDRVPLPVTYLSLRCSPASYTSYPSLTSPISVWPPSASERDGDRRYIWFQTTTTIKIFRLLDRIPLPVFPHTNKKLA